MSTEITITELPKELVELANSQPILAKDKAQEHLAAAEEKARKQAERKAKNAPDKVKIQTWIDAMKAVEQPLLKGEEAQQAFMRIQRAISDILRQAEIEINDL